MVQKRRRIRVAILEDHQSIVDGYRYRLGLNPNIEVVGVAKYGDELERLLEAITVDVLFLDITVKTSPDNPTNFPIFHFVRKFAQLYPDMSALVVSMTDSRTTIDELMQVGARGYIIKDETDVIERLGEVVETVAAGNNYVSQRVYDLLNANGDPLPNLTPRQLEALSLRAAHPDWSQADVAAAMVVEPPTVRNLLSDAYYRLGVNTQVAALQKAYDLGLLTRNSPSI